MNAKPLTILIVEPEELLAPVLRSTLSMASQADRVLSAASLSGALGAAEQQSVDVLLLDAARTGEDTEALVKLIRIRAPELPLVVITDREDDPTAPVALSAGADDCFPRAHLGNALIARSLRYAVDRRRLQATLKELSLTDELTGLYNLRGFIAFAEHHVKLASRTRGLVVGVFELAGARDLLERDGAAAMQRLVRGAADLLRATFRASDVLARVAHGEFMVLALDAAPSSVAIIEQRLGRLAATMGEDALSQTTMSGSLQPAQTLTDVETLLAQVERMRREQRRIAPLGAS